MELQLFRISKKNVLQAKNLLRFTDLTVDEISTAIGLNDANYLPRRFRKIEGMSPGEYRKNGNEKTVCANSQRGRFFSLYDTKKPPAMQVVGIIFRYKYELLC